MSKEKKPLVSVIIPVYNAEKFIRQTLDSVISQYLSTVKPMFNKFVNPSSRYADLIIPNDNKHDVAVDFLVAKLKDILK